MSGTTTQASVLSSSAVMAAGTVVSRLSGFVRNGLLVAALGTALHADVFTIANTIPNMLYILLAGGMFNAVLVPQLVRAQKCDPDGGEGYTQRVVTVAAVFLAGVSAVLVIAAPVLMRLFLTGSFFTPELAPQRESVVAFARLCLPQVFFYGMFVLLGQVLNARGCFGPMMWAPIANNVISVAVLGGYLWAFGPVHDLCRAGASDPAALAGPGSSVGGYTTSQELLLGLGSTLGIAAQLAILLPYLHRAGFTFRPRLDLRGRGLGHTLRLGIWTMLFVVVNQVAYTVVVRIASSGTADAVTGVCHSAQSGTGYTIYSTAFLLVMVPHSIATVSLATAMLPRLSASAADADLRGLSGQVAETLRTAYAVIVPFALLLPVIALDLSNVMIGYGAARPSVPEFAVTLALFAPGLVLFTTHYLVLRGFYALERTRTVFWVQCVIAATNICLAVALTRQVSPAHTAPGLVVAYAGAYLVGAVVSYSVLRRLLGGLETPVLVRFLVRLLIASALAVAVAWAVRSGLHAAWSGAGPGGGAAKAESVSTLAVTTLADVGVLLVLARVLRITEVTAVVHALTGRLRR